MSWHVPKLEVRPISYQCVTSIDPFLDPKRPELVTWKLNSINNLKTLLETIYAWQMEYHFLKLSLSPEKSIVIIQLWREILLILKWGVTASNTLINHYSFMMTFFDGYFHIQSSFLDKKNFSLQKDETFVYTFRLVKAKFDFSKLALDDNFGCPTTLHRLGRICDFSTRTEG